MSNEHGASGTKLDAPEESLEELALYAVECVGRDDDLPRLTRALLVEQRKGVVVRGRPGIGKTTLVRRFAQTYVAASGGKVRWVHGDQKAALRDSWNVSSAARDLVVIDETSSRDSSGFRFLELLPRAARLIVLTRCEPPFPVPVDLALELGGLPAAAVAGLLRRAGVPTARR